MEDSPNSRLSIKFQREYLRNAPEFPNSSGLIPATTLGYVLTAVSELMRSTWDYAIKNTSDERFDAVRKLEDQQLFQRRDIELVIVNTRAGSIEMVLDWLAPILSSDILQTAVIGMSPNALWDLTKYSFGTIHGLINRRCDSQQKKNGDDENDPLTNRILPEILEIARNGYREHKNDIIKTSFNYRDIEGTEINFNIDKYSQGTLREANFIQTKIVTRLAGTIEGLNWRKRNVTIRYELFPEEEMVCDVDGMDLDELSRFVPRNIKQVSQKLGFDVELAWRSGVANVFPPDAIRIIGIIPLRELGARNYRPLNGLARPSIKEFQGHLTKNEFKFLKWFAWADANWDNPNINGVVGYITRNVNILGHSVSRKEISDLIQMVNPHL